MDKFKNFIQTNSIVLGWLIFIVSFLIFFYFLYFKEKFLIIDSRKMTIQMVFVFYLLKYGLEGILKRKMKNFEDSIYNYLIILIVLLGLSFAGAHTLSTIVYQPK